MQKLQFVNNTLISLLAAISLFLTPSIFAAEHVSDKIVRSADNEVHLGSVAMDIPAEMVRRLTPLAKYLSKQTGLKVDFHASPNLNTAVEDLGTNTTQIAYLTPAAYLEARKKYDVIPLVNPLSKGKSAFTLMIAVKKDSTIKTINELRGKTFAFGDIKAKLQSAVVESAGIKLEEFASYEYLNHYDNIAKAVLNADFDAGILKDSVAEKYASGLRIIYTSPALPSYVFAVNKELPHKIVAKLKNAMLALRDDTEENRAILLSLEQGYNGFEVAADKDFDGIRKLLSQSKNK